MPLILRRAGQAPGWLPLPHATCPNRADPALPKALRRCRPGWRSGCGLAPRCSWRSRSPADLSTRPGPWAPTSSPRLPLLVPRRPETALDRRPRGRISPDVFTDQPDRLGRTPVRAHPSPVQCPGTAAVKCGRVACLVVTRSFAACGARSRLAHGRPRWEATGSDSCVPWTFVVAESLAAGCDMRWSIVPTAGEQAAVNPRGGAFARNGRGVPFVRYAAAER